MNTRESLILLVQSERHCNPASTPNAAGANAAAGANTPSRGANAAGGGPRPVNVPTAVIEPSPEGAKGTAPLGNAGGYEDVFVKTPKGWRFKARSVITPQEANAKLTAQDFVELRQLAGNERGRFDDVWTDTPNGKRFRSSGVSFRHRAGGNQGSRSAPAGRGALRRSLREDSERLAFHLANVCTARGRGQIAKQS